MFRETNVLLDQCSVDESVADKSTPTRSKYEYETIYETGSGTNAFLYAISMLGGDGSVFCLTRRIVYAGIVDTHTQILYGSC